MDEMRKSKKHDHHFDLYLPHDIVVDIFLRLPVKSLLKLRSVCKQWKATISDDDRFADAHLRVSRDALSGTRLLEERSTPTAVATQVIDVSGKHLEVISVAAIDPPPELLPPRGVGTLAHCDGLQLMMGIGPNNYLLWNPSNRTYKPISYPYPLDECKNLTGICYAMNDYKVVIGDAKGYAVLSCQANSWSQMREAHDTAFFSRDSYGGRGASFAGSIYWGSTSMGEYEYEYSSNDDDDCQCEIVCFDGRDEKWKSVRKFETIRFDLHLVSSPKALYAFRSMIDGEIEVMKMEVGEGEGEGEYTWSKTKVLRLPDTWDLGIPKCWIHRDKIIVEVCPDECLVLYDHTTGCVEEIQNTPDHPRFQLRGIMIPPMDNIFSLTTRNHN